MRACRGWCREHYEHVRSLAVAKLAEVSEQRQEDLLSALVTIGCQNVEPVDVRSIFHVVLPHRTT